MSDVTNDMRLIDELLKRIALNENDRGIKNVAVANVARAINDPDGHCSIEEENEDSGQDN